jgi:ATP synthase protein I
MLKPYRKQAYKLIILQNTVVIILGVICLIASGSRAAYSAILGGLACILPSIYFVRKFFSSRDRSTAKIMFDFYLGEFLKLFLSAILLILIFKFIPVKLIALISGYILANLANWLMPFVYRC